MLIREKHPAFYPETAQKLPRKEPENSQKILTAIRKTPLREEGSWRNFWVCQVLLYGHKWKGSRN
jgi:hypothetical protein